MRSGAPAQVFTMSRSKAHRRRGRRAGSEQLRVAPFLPLPSSLLPPAPGSSVQSQSLSHHVDRPHLDAVPPRVLHELRRRVEAHRLAVEQRGAERRRLVPLEPRRGVDQQREARRVRLGKAVFAEALDLLEDPLGEFLRVAARRACRRPAARSNVPSPPLRRHAAIARRSWSASPGVKPAATIASCITCSWKIGTPSVRSSTCLHRVARIGRPAPALSRAAGTDAPCRPGSDPGARSRPRSRGRRNCAASAAAASLICARDSIWNTPTVSAVQIMS